MKRAFVCPGGRKRGVGPAPAGRCMAEFIQGEGSREGSEPRALDGSIRPHGRSREEAQQRCGFAQLSRTQLHWGGGMMVR